MNKDILKIINATDADRLALFESTANEMDVTGDLIEKDFWVCAVLDVMFNVISPEYKGDELFLFKGGTSLSKCFNKINRFSEDIDIVVSRHFLGFHGEDDPLAVDHKFPSKNKRKAAIEKLAEACSTYITVDLKARLEKEFPTVNIELDDKDPTTLHVEYPSCYPSLSDKYVRGAVKIEAGAKSAVIPSSMETVTPYITALTELEIDITISNINSILPERTFLDKLLILHGWNKGVTDNIERLPNPENRLSRHYYDVARLWNSELRESILSMSDLLESVRSHNIHSGFSMAWMKTNDVTFETLEIIPNKDLLAVLRKDYDLMKSMMFGEVPSFDWVMESIADMDSAIKNEYSSSLSKRFKF